MRSFRLFFSLAVALMMIQAGQQAFAQDTATAEPASEIASAAPSGAALMALPTSFKLDGLHMVWQDLNRCSAAALTIDFTYYQWDGDYGRTMKFLNPHLEDVSVRLDEMAAFAKSEGMDGIARTGGTIELLKVLVANGFPVLVENTYYDGDNLNRDWMSHNRVIVGYDEDKKVLYSFDSLLGAGPDSTGREVAYEDFEKRWRPFNRDYFVLYRPESAALLSALMGDQWDETANAEWTVQQADDDLAGEHADSFAMFNKGQALAMLGRYEESAAAFDKARATGLPWRMMWYQYGAFAAYYEMGRYDDVVQLARNTIAATPGVEEMYYYLAFSYLAQGDSERALANMEVAAIRNPNFSLATSALAALKAGETPAFVPVL